MSIISSNGSDTTVPVQESPPPPPSPYQTNSTKRNNTSNGIVNQAYHEVDLNGDGEKSPSRSQKKDHTEIQMKDFNGPTSGGKLNEAVNTELIHDNRPVTRNPNGGTNVLDSIPHKPQSEFGPYEKFPEYFISVNQHKKFFTRGEKLSVTKDNRDGNRRLGKTIGWAIGGALLTVIVIVAVLAAVGLVSVKNSTGITSSSHQMSTTPNTPTVTIESSTISTEDYEISSPMTFQPTSSETTYDSSETPISNTYVPQAAEIELKILNENYTDELGKPLSSKFKALASSIEDAVKEKLESDANIDFATAKVLQFMNGSVIAKIRIAWTTFQAGLETPNFSSIQKIVREWDEIDKFYIQSAATTAYRIYNLCNNFNGGCSHNCSFDDGTLQFICSCEEHQILDRDNQTCVEPPVSSTTIVPSTTLTVPQIPDEVTTNDETSSSGIDLPTTTTILVSLATTEKISTTTTGFNEIIPNNSTPGNKEETGFSSVPQLPTTTEEPDGDEEITTRIIIQDVNSKNKSEDTDQELTRNSSATKWDTAISSNDKVITSTTPVLNISFKSPLTTPIPTNQTVGTRPTVETSEEDNSGYETESDEGITILPVPSEETEESVENVPNTSTTQKSFRSIPMEEDLTTETTLLEQSRNPSMPSSRSSDEFMIFSDANIPNQESTQNANSISFESIESKENDGMTDGGEILDSNEVIQGNEIEGRMETLKQESPEIQSSDQNITLSDSNENSSSTRSKEEIATVATLLESEQQPNRIDEPTIDRNQSNAGNSSASVLEDEKSPSSGDQGTLTYAKSTTPATNTPSALSEHSSLSSDEIELTTTLSNATTR